MQYKNVDIAIDMDEVKIFDQILKRPHWMARSAWMRFWEELKGDNEDT